MQKGKFLTKMFNLVRDMSKGAHSVTETAPATRPDISSITSFLNLIFLSGASVILIEVNIKSVTVKYSVYI